MAGGEARNLLLDVAGQLRARARLARRYEERLAPDFTPFQFLDSQENDLSRVIAWLLDPSGTHAQGERFLRSFLEWCGAPWEEGELSNAKVRTEAVFTRSGRTRRIDILATSGSKAVAIENKLRAGDQNGQVGDYLEHLASAYGGGSLLVYLAQDEGRVPSSASISPERREEAEQRNRLLCRSYAGLQPWLEACRSLSSAANVSAFIDGLLLHVRRTILGVEDMDNATELAEEIGASREKLCAALEIFQAQSLVERRLGEKLLEQLQDRVAGHSGWQLINFSVEQGLGDTGAIIPLSPDDRFAFGIGFDYSRFRGFYYGLRHVAEKHHRRRASDEILNAIHDILGCVRSTPAWPAWKHPSANDAFFPYSRDPGLDPRFWLDLQDGTFADRLVRFVEQVATHLKSRRLNGRLAGYRGE